MRFIAATLLFVILCAAPRLAAAQGEVPSLRWQTITTENFRIHFEPELRAWAEDIARHIESVRLAVAARVGYAPPQVIDLIVEDPFNQPNGSAWPSLTTPAMRFWATPPAPSSVLGASRGWGEILAVHEYAHLAHLLRPSRAPLKTLTSILSGLPVGPLVSLPGWVIEGYATVIEGELTGAGRPNGVARPALLRQLALEGALPTYAGLNASGSFNGGSLRYLAGSAYLEWLQAQRGDSALPQLWRRATARQKREFPEAFRGVFGEGPEVLYGRFASELTANAHAARDAIEAASPENARDTLAQRWTWYVGAPAISPDGQRIAVRQSSPTAGTRVRVLSFEARTLSEKDSLKIEKRYEKDPEDVRPIDIFPKAYTQKAALGPVGGAGFDAPRWFDDSKRLLVVRSVPSSDGRVRPDLFEWNTESGAVRRVTTRAGVLMADPLPGGSAAAALTCGAGSCSVVLIELASGRVRELARGGLDQAFHGVRVSPDGRRIASARQSGATWHPVVIDVVTGAIEQVGPADGASRYTPAWESDSTLIVVSEASGVATLERLALRSSETRVVARTVGAASAPDVGPDGRTWWLDLHARGYDLRVTEAGTAMPTSGSLDVAQYPAVQRADTARAVSFAPQELRPARRYGVGPLGATLLVSTSAGADGETFAAGISVGDPIGRLNLQAMGGVADSGAWRGARASLTWRGFRPSVQIQGWTARHDPSFQGRLGGTGVEAFDADYAGGLIAFAQDVSGARGVSTLRLVGSAGELGNPTTGTAGVTRALFFSDFSSQLLFSPTPTLRVTSAVSVHAASGRTDATTWDRTLGELALGIRRLDGLGLGVRARAGAVSDGTPAWEQFSVGGSASPYVDGGVLSQRIEQPGLPFATRRGQKLAMLTAETAGPLRAYHEWIAAGDDYGPWTRVVGVEVAMATPRIAVFRLPNARLRTGVSHVLNSPLANTTVAYALFSFLP